MSSDFMPSASAMERDETDENEDRTEAPETAAAERGKATAVVIGAAVLS
jgi:hypothetical protein